MSARHMMLLSLIAIPLVLVGCSSSTPGGDPSPDGPGPAAGTVTAGSLSMEVESPADFVMATLATSGNVGFTVLSGTTIHRLHEAGPDQEWIAFSGDDPLGTDQEIFLIKPDGTGLTQVTDNADNDWQPAWSPDGIQLAFQQQAAPDREIHVINVDGSGDTNITDNTIHDQEPHWSPSGDRIVFGQNPGSTTDIWAMDTDGSNLSRLTDNSVDDITPDWSPDGTKVAFSQNLSGDYEICIMNADGTGQTIVTSNAVDDLSPAWAPNGRRIVFSRFDGSDHELWTMAPDGSGAQTVTNNAQHDRSPDWSPDASRIVFYRDTGIGDEDLWTVKPDGTGERRLTNNATTDAHPAWSPIPRVKRALIGAPSTDLGCDPPFGPARPMAIIGLTADGMVSATTVVMNDYDWSSLRVEPLQDFSDQLAAVRTSGRYVKGFKEDMGFGKDPVLWELRAKPITTNALVLLSVETGRIASIIASSETIASGVSDAVAEPGGQLVLRGAFTQAYSAADPSRNLISGSATEVVVDERTGAVLSAH